MYHLHTFSCTYFYSHPREGGDMHDFNIFRSQVSFLFTPPRRGRLCEFDGNTPSDTFLFTPPRRGRRCCNALEILVLDFYSRPREGGDFTIATFRSSRTISIHAPAKGATFQKALLPHWKSISIHAPAKGATQLST